MRSSFGPGFGVGLVVIVNGSPFWESMTVWWVVDMMVEWKGDIIVVSMVSCL